MAALQGPRWPALWVAAAHGAAHPALAPVIASQLAGGALAKVAPAGGAVGAALQYRMLVEAGFERGRRRPGSPR